MANKPSIPAKTTTIVVPKNTTPAPIKFRDIDASQNSKLELHIRRDDININLPKKNNLQWYIGGVNLLITVILFVISRKFISSDKQKERSHDSKLFLYQRSLFPMSDKTLSYIGSINGNFHESLEKSQSHKPNSAKRIQVVQTALDIAEELQNSFLTEELSKSLIFSKPINDTLKKYEEDFSDNHQKLLSKIPSSTLSIQATAELVNQHNDNKASFLERTNDLIKSSQPQFNK
ncbi:hypothetical protein BIY24_05440 [Halobacteriovorax marinus]|uniref:hypothetical protein n=1 Tax=Halobacteriovorax marinus TaxID=97084 RepID=UPI000BC34245|nr:hypothetical protein [Halobacteriovorax marinus]ATH07401.1 hypothetical protein BIY24_05440 [Halobacteriovorax marinus]